MKPIFQILLLPFFCLIGLPTNVKAQNITCDDTSLQGFFDFYGGTSAFSTHTMDAVTTFIQVEDALEAGQYPQAKMLLDDLFDTYPKGDNIWWNVFNDPNGANLGTPHAYYGLRMMEDIADYHLAAVQNVDVKTAIMKIVLVGCSEGIQPTTEAELQNGTGPFVTNSLDPELMENDYCTIRQSLQLFSKYVTAITNGQLELEIEFIELPDLCMDVNVSNTTPYVASGSIQPVWDALSDDIKESTDWWWILYPSHVPEFPTFNDEAFITGGMGLDAKGGPVFIIDDKWVGRKPAHLGNGDYNDIERRIYLPQWLQHEFFHHLYRLYPEFSLEVNGHDWFDLSFWPSDFEGRFEADFYAESLHKRLQGACVPLATKLITRADNNFEEQLSALTMVDILGPYTLDNILNPWHIGEIIEQNGNYFWRNSANVQWQVTPNLAEGKLETGPDSPYPGQDFFIELYQTDEGNYLPGVTALKYQGEFYNKRFNMLRETAPLEITLDLHESTCLDSLVDSGHLLKEAGQFYWQTSTNELWSLTPNTEAEVFLLHDDSPTPGESFELILAADPCNLYALGFKYADLYYWRPKRDQQDPSPTLVNPLADLEIQEGFGTYPIDISDVFEDVEGDTLLLFASSSASTFLSTEIIGEQLVLSGGELGAATILLMALDINGGLAMDKFDIQVSELVSNHEVESGDASLSIFPNLTPDYVNILGDTSDYNISIYSVNQTVRQDFAASGPTIRLDISHLPAGLYFIVVSDPKSGKKTVKKLIKQ